MAIKSILLLLVLTLTRSDLYSQPKSFTILGEVRGMDTGKVTLNIDNGGKIISESKIESGKFILSGTLKEPVKCTITMNFNEEPIPVFLEGTQYRLLVNNAPFNYQLKGGDLNMKFTNYVDAIMGYYDGFVKLAVIRRNYLNESDTGRLKIVGAQIDSTMSFLNKRAIEVSERFIRDDTDSYIAPRIISNLLFFGKSNLQIASGYYSMLTEKIKSSAEGKYLEREIKNASEAVQVGNHFPLFRLKDENNREVVLKKSSNVKYTFLNFWATWCGPCLQEFPSLRSVYNEFKMNGIAFINISLDKNKGRWLAYVSEHPFPWAQLIDDFDSTHSIARALRIDAIPSSFLLDGDLKIIAKDITAEQLRLRLTDLLK